MTHTLGISPKVILPIIGHAIVAIALAVSGHMDLAVQYAAASIPVTGLLGYAAHAGVTLHRSEAGAVSAEIDPAVLAAAVEAEIQRRVNAASVPTVAAPVAPGA